MSGGTVIIDDPSCGGSDDGAWATHIAHTPHLAAQCNAFHRAQPSGRTDSARSADRVSLDTIGSGEAGGDCPLDPPSVSPASYPEGGR